MRRKILSFLLYITIIGLGICLLIGRVLNACQKNNLSDEIILSNEYREQRLSEELCEFLKTASNPGKCVGLYLLESKYGYSNWNYDYTENVFEQLEKDWKKNNTYESYISTTESIWNDVKYFPVPEFTSDSSLTVSYVNTWMSERTYGGQRGHEGTDLMASENKRGLYPIISMTDGVVTKKGWLEKGGYRIGVESPSGAYFYYAHLESYANINIGDEIKAGDILGFMGDSGYGEEGTVGQFPVHLHLGIYIYPDGNEISVNPYWVLRYIENRKVKCYTEI